MRGPDSWPHTADRLLGEACSRSPRSIGSGTRCRRKTVCTNSALASLYLNHCKSVSDQGLRHTSTLPVLHGLQLGATGITDAGPAHLTSLTSLSNLNVSHTAITDDGLRSIGQLHGLKPLYVKYTIATDVGLESLGDLQQMKSLILDDTLVRLSTHGHRTALLKKDRLASPVNSAKRSEATTGVGCEA